MSIEIISEGIGSLIETAASLPQGEAQKNLINALKAASANCDIIKASANKPLSNNETIKLVVSKHITIEGGKKVLDGITYAGDIPPHVVNAKYNALMNSGIEQVNAVATPAVETAKKSLPAAADSETTKQANEDENELLNLAETKDEDLSYKVELATKYLQKVDSVKKLNNASAHPTMVLFLIARAADLILPHEIDSTSPTGYSQDLTRLDVCERLFDFIQQQKQGTDEQG